MTNEQQVHYWKESLTYVVVLLAISFGASFGAGILFADQLDAVEIAGFPLGFWFANQGSLVIFVVVTFVYAGLMNRLDRKYGVHER